MPELEEQETDTTRFEKAIGDLAKASGIAADSIREILRKLKESK